MTSRRTFCQSLAAAGLLASTRASDAGESKPPFEFRYVLSSALYGKMPLAEILPQVAATGSECLDVWCLPHGNQREQVREMSVDRFAEILREHKVKLGVLTQYPLGPFRLAEELKTLRRLGGQMIVTGTSGPSEPTGDEAKQAVRSFLEKMKPHLAAAEEAGAILAVENHSKQFLYTPDSLRYFAELNRSPHLGIAFAPHHLHKFEDEIPQLILDLGAEQIPFFYAQEHGRGSSEKVEKEEELKQLPGFGGGLDYEPIIAALKKIGFHGLLEIFMHPTPRGVPILPTAAEISAVVNKSRAYLEACSAKI